MDFSNLIHNLSQKGETYEKILGGKHNRAALASFIEHYSDILSLMSIYNLYNFVSTQSFTKEQLEAYQLAINDMGKFFMGCALEEKNSLQPPEEDI